jgi:hypothetical protein
MNIEDAVNQASRTPIKAEALNVIGSIEKDAGSGKVRVYPDPYNMSRYVLIDPESVAGDVLDVTEHARRLNPSRRNPVFSVPVRKGAEIEIVSVTKVTITDVAKMRRLSLNQSGCCGCSPEGEGEVARARGCHIGGCTTVEGASYDCWENWEGYVLCSGCCLIASA